MVPENDDKVADLVFDDPYFRVNKKLQRISGLWPSQSTIYKYIFRTPLTMCMLIMFIPMIRGCKVWCGVNLDVCGENIAGIMYDLNFLLKYYLTVMNTEKLRKIYIRLSNNWINTKDPNEKKILEEFAAVGKTKTILYSTYIILAGVAFCQLPMVPVVLNLVLPENKSIERIPFVKAEFGFDQFDYFYQVYVCFCILGLGSSIAIGCIDATYTVVVQQILAIFEIVKYRINLATRSFDPDKDVGYDIILKAIKLHKEGLDFIDNIETSYTYFFLAVYILTVIFLSVGTIVISSPNSEFLDKVKLATLFVGVIIHLLYLSLPGQALIDQSGDLFVSTYCTEWYNASERSKKLLKIFMLRCYKPCMFTGGPIFVINYETFGKMMKTTLSYITVIKSFE